MNEPHANEQRLAALEELKKLRVKLAGIVVNRKETPKVTEVLRQHRVLFQFVCLAEGTANSELLDLLGLDSSEKSLVIFPILDIKVEDIFHSMNEEFSLKKVGKGIAFTVPITSVSNILQRLAGENITAEQLQKQEKEVSQMAENATHDLLLAVINRGFSDDLMTAAKAAGARGGTILHGRRVGLEDAVKFLGVEIQEEKEIVFILVRKEDKLPIMKAINSACGMSSEAKGFVLAMPVDTILGLA